MKNNTTTLHDEGELNNSEASGKEAKGQVWKLGLDVDLRHIVAAIECERSWIGPAQKFSRAQLLGWVKEKIAQGHTFHTAYECCGFGYSFIEWLDLFIAFMDNARARVLRVARPPNQMRSL